MMNWIVKQSKIVSILVCFMLLTVTAIPVQAKKTSDDLQQQADQLNEKSENLKDEEKKLDADLKQINGEINQLEGEIAEVESKIESTNNSIEVTQETLSIATTKKDAQYDAMKLRIKYMYENDDASLLGMLFNADDMQDFLNKADFIQNISSYDREQLSELVDMMNIVKSQQKELEDKKVVLQEMEDDLDVKQTQLEMKARETSADITKINGRIAKLKAEASAKAEEAAAARAAEEAAAAAAAAEAARKAAAADGSNPAGAYSYPSGNGVLTKSKGVNYYNGHKETWYSQRVLPGGGLNIPGRHVRSDGVIVDKDGYICVASEDYPKGTVVDTSLGKAKVYDCGCAHGVIDIYVDW